jgi:hypothetical protein
MSKCESSVDLATVAGLTADAQTAFCGCVSVSGRFFEQGNGVNFILLNTVTVQITACKIIYCDRIVGFGRLVIKRRGHSVVNIASNSEFSADPEGADAFVAALLCAAQKVFNCKRFVLFTSEAITVAKTEIVISFGVFKCRGSREAIEGKVTGNIIKEIYVPGRIVNIVVK